MTDLVELERRLWAAADELRANSTLTAAQYRDPVGDVETFSKLVHATRNYLVHWNPDLESKAAKGEALVRLTEAMRLILESLLLLELSFTADEIEQLIAGNWTIERDLDFAFET